MPVGSVPLWSYTCAVHPVVLSDCINVVWRNDSIVSRRGWFNGGGGRRSGCFQAAMCRAVFRVWMSLVREPQAVLSRNLQFNVMVSAVHLDSP